MSDWNERTIWRAVDEEGWRLQQEYRRRVWRNKIEFEKLVHDRIKPESGDTSNDY